jgi:hypothetical protein
MHLRRYVMALYTFVLDYDGGTYISQVKADDVQGAVENWVMHGLDLDALEIENTKREDLLEEVREPDNNAEPITGTKNVWCTSIDIGDDIGLVHFVKTVEWNGEVVLLSGPQQS